MSAMRMQDLASVYQAKADEELLQLANNSEQLTPDAQSLLIGELTRRRLNGSGMKLGEERHQQPERHSLHKKFVSGSIGVGEFVAEVLRFYHSRFWFFIKLIFPAVLVG